MRIVFFGSGGDYSARVLDALAAGGEVVGVILPVVPGFGWKGVIRRGVTWHLSRHLRRVAAARRLTVHRRRGDTLESLVRSLAPDLVCVATFPNILAPTVLAVPRYGCLNVHPSLLPRHRGGDPIFWTYCCDDRETGVTVHWMDERVDAGDIAAQTRVPLERGLPAKDLNARLGTLGGELLVRVVAAVASGTGTRVTQDERLATHEPLASRNDFRIDYASWSAERVWHSLRGIGTRLVCDGDGRRLLVGNATQYWLQSHDKRPGTFIANRLYCVDGWVELAPAPLRRRMAAALFQST